MCMNCNIIKGLLPSYINGICSDDTVKVIEEHLQHCEECKQMLKKMQEQTNYTQKIPEEVKDTITPLKKINKKHRIQVIAAIVMTFILTIVAAFVIQEVEAVRQILFPTVTADVNVTDDTEEWEKVYFGDHDYLVFDSIFFKKEIVNSAYSERDIVLRIKDANNNVLLDEILIPSGTSIDLDELKRNEKYIVEMKAPQGRFFINAI